MNKNSIKSKTMKERKGMVSVENVIKNVKFGVLLLVPFLLLISLTMLK